jgi:hypothetical protein
VVVTRTVHGDPASLSQTGGALRQLATRLRTTGRRAHAAFDDASAGDATNGRRDRVVTVARRQYDAVDAAAAAAAVELDRAGAAVQAHASDLAEALALARSLAARADAAGLRVVDGVVLPAWGVAGVAEASAAQSREQVQQQLQAELDQLGVLLARRRSTLVATLAGSRELLATHAARLR